MPRALSDEATIQWYPGHMARAMRRLAEDMQAIDIVIEVADARTPRAGTHPALALLAGQRPRILVLTREQLADPRATAAWLDAYRAEGRTTLRAIAAALNERGVRTARGGEWHDSTVRNLLTRAAGA